MHAAIRIGCAYLRRSGESARPTYGTPARLFLHSRNMVRLEIASLRDAGKWRSVLVEEELCTADALRNPEVRRRFQVTRGLRRKMLSDATGIPAFELRFLEGEGNKPRLAPDAGWDFNVSHAGEYVACAVSKDPVGIDIERMRAVREMEGIVARYFHPDEAEAWRALASGLRTEAFFVLWSAREAAMKCTGLGLARGNAVTRVDPRIIAGREAAARVGGVRVIVRGHSAPPGYVAAVASGAEL